MREKEGRIKGNGKKAREGGECAERKEERKKNLTKEDCRRHVMY